MKHSRVFLFSFSVALIVLSGALERRLEAFRPLPGERSPFLFRDDSSDDDEVSLFQMETHGEVRPAIPTTLSPIDMKFRSRKVKWLGQVGSSGARELWGAGLVQFREDADPRGIEAVLREIVDTNSEVFRVRSRDLLLDRRRSQLGRRTSVFVFQRVYRVGDDVESYYPVEGSFVSFRIKHRRLVAITNHSYGTIAEIEPPSITSEEALDYAMEDAQFQMDQDRVSGRVRSELQPYVTRDGRVLFRFVYQLSLRKTFPQGLWNYSVSAETGRVVRIRNGFRTVEGQVGGEIYPRMPGQDLILAGLGGATIELGDQKVVTDEAGAFEIDGEGEVMASLEGPRVRVRAGGQRPISARPNLDGVIAFRAQTSLTENMTFFHINRVNRLVSGFIQHEFLGAPISVNTHVKDSEITGCNAWYDPDQRTLNFLSEDQECRDSGQFSDIIYHEWGHALDDALGGIQDGAFSEAIGDVTAALLTNDSRLAPGFIKNEDEPELPIRDLSTLKIFPRDRSRNPHTEGLIVGGAWFSVMRQMQSHYNDQEGRSRLAGIFFNHLVTTENYLDSYQGALVADDDDGNLSNCTPHLCFFNEAFSKRGLAKVDRRCLGEKIEGFAACGESTILLEERDGAR